jgi:hypothetical protein
MSDVTLESRISRREEILTADMSGETVMLSMERGMYYGMQTVATFIWDLIEQPRTIAEVSDAVVAHFDGAERQQCQQDVLAFVNDLRREELIDVHEAKAA